MRGGPGGLGAGRGGPGASDYLEPDPTTALEPLIDVTLNASATTYDLTIDGNDVERVDVLLILTNPDLVLDEQVVMEPLDATNTALATRSSKYLIDGASGGSAYWRLADVYNNSGWTRIIGSFELKTGKPRSFAVRAEQMTGAGTLVQWSTVGILTDTTTAIKKLRLYGYAGGTLANGLGAGSRLKVWRR